jgi:hypothetical protein
MSAPTKPIAPAQLEKAGADFYLQVVEQYELRVDETRLLLDICGEIDLVDVLASEQKTSDLLVRGSQGQLVASPLVSELRQHRATLASLIRQLRLPDEDGSSAGSLAGAALVARRWGNGTRRPRTDSSA